MLFIELDRALSSCFNDFYRNDKDNKYGIDFVYDRMSGLCNAEFEINDKEVLFGFTDECKGNIPKVVCQFFPLDNLSEVEQVDPMFIINKDWSEREFCNSLKKYIEENIYLISNTY